jgi:tRNA (guanine37-N1)-methyltransferase
LEGPQYTKPPSFRGLTVPEVLTSGNHKAVSLWRRQQAIRRTFQKRPDLLEKANLNKEDQLFLKAIKKNEDLF